MPIQPALAEEFVTASRGRVRFEEPMRLHTTFHIGGPAEIWVEPQDAQQLGQFLKIAREEGLPVTVIGGGANLLVRDDGIPGLVIHLGNPSFQEYRSADQGVVVGAGLPLEWLIRKAQEQSVSGVEFLAGVPGRVGGAVRMNAGTHDDEGKVHSFSDVVRSITVMDLEGNRRIVPREAVGFAYRSTRLNGQIVLEAQLELTPDDPAKIADKVKRLWNLKRRTQDWSNPSAGCIFKNPPEGQPAAGWMIERCDLKGFQVGQVMVSRIHSNFVMNLGNAKASDALDLIEEIRARVRRQFEVELELEVHILPKEGVDWP